MPPPSNLPNASAAAAQLVQTLQLATDEMRAAENASALDETKSHAEAVVNILVGQYGRWYGDQNGDNQVTDASDKRGVLPGEKIPVGGGADLDRPAQFPYGLAIMAMGTRTTSPELEILLGDVTLWRTRARGGFDAIENAVAQQNAAAVQGAVPRAVASARLILTDAQTIETAQPLAADGVAELERALQAAQKMAQ